MTQRHSGDPGTPRSPGPGRPSESCPQFRCDRPRRTGDHATIPTTSRIAQAAAALAQHLHDMTPDGPVHWRIATPYGTTHTGHLRLNAPGELKQRNPTPT